jgi:hypothetical protein
VGSSERSQRASCRWLMLMAAMISILAAGCAVGSTTSHCATLPACTAAGSRRLGQVVLVPQGATFVQGEIKQGVLGVEFRDTATGRRFSMFVGHPASGTTSCPGTVITLSTTRRFCYGRTTELLAQFTAQRLLYTLTVSLPSGSVSTGPAAAVSDQELVTRIVSAMA